MVNEPGVVSPTLPPSTDWPEPLWNEFRAYLNQWFYLPDMEAVSAVLAIATSHYVSQSDPAWAFIVGPSGSGKTSIGIQCCSKIPGAFVESDVSPKSFISHKGTGPKSKPSGLLIEMGASGIILFKDFTSILSKRDEDRAQIIGALREIYDGNWKHRTGMMGATPWVGRVTCLAATTPAIEDFWSIHRDLGERFVTIRWPFHGSERINEFADRQFGHEREIKTKVADYGARMVACAKGRTVTSLPEKWRKKISGLALSVARLRGVVSRAKHDRNIIERHAIEESGRLHKSLSLIMSAHGAMFQREPDERDFQIARRVARDTVPPNRAAFLSGFFPTEPKLKRSEITGLRAATVARIGEDLEELGVIKIENLDNPDSPGTRFVLYSLNTEREGWITALRTLYGEAFP